MPEVAVARAQRLTRWAVVNCDEAARLQDVARVLRIDALMLKVHAQEVRGARRLLGASDLDALDASLVASTLWDAALCAACIARRAGLSVPRVDEVTLTMHTSAMVARCHGCLKQTVVHRLG